MLELFVPEVVANEDGTSEEIVLGKASGTHPLIGRQLVHFFRAAGARNYSAGAVLGMDHDQGLYKRWYRMTAEAVRPAAISMNLMSSEEFDPLVATLRELEADFHSVVFKFPDVWVIANV
jgi:hypothetical protein